MAVYTGAAIQAKNISTVRLYRHRYSGMKYLNGSTILAPLFSHKYLNGPTIPTPLFRHKISQCPGYTGTVIQA
jgi:hypothetical protein